MPSLDEFAGAAFVSPLGAVLRDGIEAISGGQTITFVKYTRQVLPLDGFVFWVRSSLLGDTTAPLVIAGDLHAASEKTQAESESITRVAVVFTTGVDAQQAFNSIAPNQIYIGSVAGDAGSVPIRFAFGRLGAYQQNAAIFHYSGMALYPQMASQIIDDPTQFNTANLIVSNSLPAWLTLNDYAPFYGFGNTIPLYPSMLSPLNITPPYGVIHIYPESTIALASVPRIGFKSSHHQIAKDRVKVTFFGVDNDGVATFMDCALQYMKDYDIIGLMNAPIIQDEKATQVEFGIIGSKKSIEFEVSYNQTSIRTIARQMIDIAGLGVSPVYPTKWEDPNPPDPISP